MDPIHVGDVLRLRNARNYGSDGKSWVEHRVHKGEVLVVVVLGIEPRVLPAPSEAVDPDKALEAMGWVRKPPKHPRAIRKAK